MVSEKEVSATRPEIKAARLTSTLGAEIRESFIQQLNIMSLPCPQRDALEEIANQTKPWSSEQISRITPKTHLFVTPGGGVLYLLGISNGAGMRDKPNLHIAVFGLQPPRGGVPDNAQLLPMCQYGALITSPDDDPGVHWAEYLDIQSIRGTVVELQPNGHRAWYRLI